MDYKNSYIRGWHHDYENYFEMYGNIVIQDRVFKQGCMFARVGWEGGKMSGKTFFPQDWSREKVAMKIHEAFKNLELEDNLHPERFEAIGKTSEGIHIHFYIEKDGRSLSVLSASPCKRWLLGIK